MNLKDQNHVMVNIGYGARYLMRVEDAVELLGLISRAIPCKSDAAPLDLKSDEAQIQIKTITPGMLTQQQIDLLTGLKDPS
jgi:hypothetical protein